MICLPPPRFLESKTGENFIRRSTRVVNGLENLCDSLWSAYRQKLDEHTAAAYAAMVRLVNQLPVHTDEGKAKLGHIDFKSRPGLRQRNRFFVSLSKIYANWEASILGDLDIMKWKRGTPAWEKSLGLSFHRGGKFLMKMRDEIARKIAELGSLHTKHSVEEGFPKLNQIKIVRKILPHKLPAISTRGYKVPLTGKQVFFDSAKQAIQDQEKSWLENVLKGMEQLARNHSNEIFDVAGGEPTRDQLFAAMRKFSPSEMPKKQLLLSVQTHARAMIRRALADEKAFPANNFLQVPDTRAGASVTKSITDRAFKIVARADQLAGAGGKADSLGMFPGDKMQAIPIPAGVDIKDDAAAAREAFLKAHGS